MGTLFSSICNYASFCSSRSMARTVMPYTARANSADAFKKRERAMENAYFNKKDHELLLKLKEKAAAAHAAGEEISEEAHDLAGTSAIDAYDFSAESVDMDDLMTLRKELLDRITALEDVIGTLKYRQSKLLMKTSKW